MLTQSEREWLEQRASALDKYGCYSVEFYRIREVFLDIYGYKDAAEFEARVAAKLAEMAIAGIGRQPSHEVISKLGWYGAALMIARITVEEEMDADQYFNDIEDENLRIALKTAKRRAGC